MPVIQIRIYRSLSIKIIRILIGERYSLANHAAFAANQEILNRLLGPIQNHFTRLTTRQCFKRVSKIVYFKMMGNNG